MLAVPLFFQDPRAGQRLGEGLDVVLYGAGEGFAIQALGTVQRRLHLHADLLDGQGLQLLQRGYACADFRVVLAGPVGVVPDQGHGRRVRRHCQGECQG
ncbi:hypothetical protein D3C77_672140 [compost metagenome]